jgi:GTPase-activating protein SST2
MKSAKYEQTLKNYDFDSIAPRQPSHVPERSISRATEAGNR